MSQRIHIEVVSDTVCPWCFVGKRQLERALARMPDVQAEVTWKPFFLDPSIPDEGVDAHAYLTAKFGSPRVLEVMHTRIAGIAEEAGIHFRFDLQTRRPNTLDSHRVVTWARAAGVQNQVVDALFRAYFEQGKDLGDRDVLAAVAESAGMNADELRARLETDDDVARVKDEAQAAMEKEITGVPCFDIEGFRLPGAQTPDVYEHVIRRVLARR